MSRTHATHVTLKAPNMRSQLESEVKSWRFEPCLSTWCKLVMMDLPWSPRGRSGWEKSIQARNSAVACGEELHQVLSSERIQWEAADRAPAERRLWSARRTLQFVNQTEGRLSRPLARVCTLAPENKDKSIIAMWANIKIKMTRPRSDSSVSTASTPSDPVPSYFCSFKLLSKWATGGKLRSALGWQRHSRNIKDPILPFVSVEAANNLDVCRREGCDDKYEMNHWQYIFI